MAAAIAIGLCVSDRIAAQQTDRAAAESFETTKDVAYVERGDETLRADVYVPRGEGPFPGVLMVHGGAWRAGNKRITARLAIELARHRFSVVSINYRLAPKHKFPAQLEDCEAALRFMRLSARQYKIDPKRIGGCGYSAGGHLVALLAATRHRERLRSEDPQQQEQVSTRLQAVLAGGTPTDFRVLPKTSKVLTYWLGDTRAQQPDIYLKASPRYFVTQDDPPMFFYHGEHDRLVPKISAIAMVARLREVGVPSELVLVPEAGHIDAYLNEKAFQKGIEFLEKHLKEKDEG